MVSASADSFSVRADFQFATTCESPKLTLSQLAVFPIRTIEEIPPVHRNMRQISTFILFLAVIVTQLFGSFALRPARCAEAGCQCSVESTSNGNCCCSARSVKKDDSCCSSKKAVYCCGRDSGSEHETQDIPTICKCGCENSSTPVPAQSDSSSKELLRLICQTSDAVGSPVLPHRRTFALAPQASSFYGGLSAQPLYCSWLI